MCVQRSGLLICSILIMSIGGGPNNAKPCWLDFIPFLFIQFGHKATPQHSCALLARQAQKPDGICTLGHAIYFPASCADGISI